MTGSTRVRLPALAVIRTDLVRPYVSGSRIVTRSHVRQPTEELPGLVTLVYDDGVRERYGFDEEVEVFFPPSREAEARAAIVFNQHPAAWTRFYRLVAAHYVSRIGLPKAPDWMHSDQVRHARRYARSIMQRQVDMLAAERHYRASRKRR